VVFRVPVLGGDHNFKLWDESIRYCDDFFAFGYGKRTTIDKIVLQIDQQECLGSV
jgi:hypothetical protein